MFTARVDFCRQVLRISIAPALQHWDQYCEIFMSMVDLPSETGSHSVRCVQWQLPLHNGVIDFCFFSGLLPPAGVLVFGLTEMRSRESSSFSGIFVTVFGLDWQTVMAVWTISLGRQLFLFHLSLCAKSGIRSGLPVQAIRVFVEWICLTELFEYLMFV